MGYPKPEGWNGGPDGTMMRRGSGGRIGINRDMDDGEFDPTEDRSNASGIDDLGGIY